MRGLIHASADGVGWRTRERRRHDDLRFLEKLRTATDAQLDRMHWEGVRLPRWRQIAIDRAIARRRGE